MTTAALGRGKMHKRQYYTFECFSEIILQPNYPKACIYKVVCRINKWKTNDSFAATCEGRKFFSADELAENDEFLNSLTSAGFPPHELEVKIGCPVITLLRNLNPKIVLCAME